MSSAGLPFGIYLAVSWPITMIYALGITLFGAAFQGENRTGMIGMGAAFLVAVVFFTWYVRRYLKKSRLVDEDG